jgi:DNA-binding LacI/PurR family transcriptional regulator
VAVIRGLRERGVDVPGQFAMIAYDNLDWAPLVEPPLTCISPPRFEMGVAAGQMIVSMIEGREVESSRVLSTHMVRRRSCGCDWSPLDERGTCGT